MTSYRESIMNSGKIFYNQAVSLVQSGIEQLPTVPSTSTSMGYIFSVLPPLGGATPFAVLGFGLAATLAGHKAANMIAEGMREYADTIKYIAPKRIWMKNVIENGKKKEVPAANEDITKKNKNDGTVFYRNIKTTTYVQFGVESLKKIVCTAATEATSAVITTGLGAAAGAVIAAATATTVAPAMISAAALTALVWASVKGVQYGAIVLKEAIKVVVKGIVLIFTSIKDLCVWLFNAIKGCFTTFKNKAAAKEYVKQFEDLKRKHTVLKTQVELPENDTRFITFADLQVTPEKPSKENPITGVFVGSDRTINLLTQGKFKGDTPFTSQMRQYASVLTIRLKNYTTAIETMNFNGNYKDFGHKDSKILEPIEKELAQIEMINKLLVHIENEEKKK